MKKDLLICIAFHYSEERIQYLYKVLDNIFINYKCSYDIIIDTNIYIPDFKYNIPLKLQVIYHTNLIHPFHLTWQHRKHFKDNIDKYENFYYTEDDILLPYENYVNYIESFKFLFPDSIPAIVRIEEKGGEQFATDITEKFPNRTFGAPSPEKMFTKLNPPHNYCGFWIMPAKELKETMITDFVREHQSRETAASYTNWELNKPTMIEIKNRQISPLCYAYHLPNNYVNNPNSKNGKINPKDIFI